MSQARGLQIISDHEEETSSMTYEFESLVLDLKRECTEWARRLPDLSEHTRRRMVERAVERDRERKAHRMLERIVVDEESFSKGSLYETPICDIDWPNGVLKRTRYLWLWNEKDIPPYRQSHFEASVHWIKVSRTISATCGINKGRLDEGMLLRRYFWDTHSRIGPMIKAVKSLKLFMVSIHCILPSRCYGYNSAGE